MPPAFLPDLQSLLTVNGLPAAFVIAAVLLTVSVLASKISDRFGIPALLLFLAMGMLAGSDGPGGIYFDDYALAQGVGTAALVFILFSGGLDTRWTDIRPVLAPGIALSTAGVMLTALLAALAAHALLGFSFIEGLLLGGIVSSTDAAAVLSILRAKGINLKGRLEPLLELEAGSNDPTAVFLTLGVIPGTHTARRRAVEPDRAVSVADGAGRGPGVWHGTSDGRRDQPVAPGL